MSVVGFDLGTESCKVAVAHKKKIQVVPNELTKLLTPTLLSFSPKERCFGDGAKTQYFRNYKNTISQMKRWLGRKANDPKIQEEAKFWLPGITTGTLPDGRFGINVDTSQGQLCLASEQILCGLLGQLKKFTSQFLDGLKVTDCVIACPSFYDDAQRRALLNAAKLAELKVLRLLEEPTAIALNYGILRNLPENDTQRVIFVDFGYASTQVAIVDFVRGKLSVRYKSSNPFLGGRDFDQCLYNVFRKQWQDKHNVDVDHLPKQKLKLLRACKQIKKILSGNKDAIWILDCFHNDHDLKIEIHRNELEEAAEEQGLYSSLLEPLIEALEATKDDGVTIHSCEIVGGPVRVNSIQNRILECVQKYESSITNLSTTLNGDECIARGCALMCAMLSPNFRVREFQVQDILTWPITISYPTEKENAHKKIIEQLIIKRGNPQPCTAKVMFNKTKNFVFKLQHPNQYHETIEEVKTDISIIYPFNTNLNIGEFNVQLLPLSENAVQPPKIKLLLDINKHGVLNWPQASLIEYVKREKKPTPPPPKTDKDKKSDKKDDKKDKKDDKKDKTNDKKDKKDDDNDSEMKNNENENENENENKTEDNEKKTDDNNNNKMDVDSSKDNKTDDSSKDKEKEKDKSTEKKKDKDKDSKKKDKKKDKKKITRDLIITGNFFNEMKADAFNKMFEIEANFLNIDRIVHETDEAKNDLETYIYSLRDKIDTTHKNYIHSNDRGLLSKQLTEMEDWVYEEGDAANKTAFLERLKQLRDIGDPMEYRLWECQHREQRVNNIKKLIFKYQQWPETIENDEKYSHIGDDKKKEMIKYASDIDAWITNNLIKQDRLKPYETPVLKCKDIDNKYRELYNKCNAIVMIPKPKPKTPTPPPPTKDDETKDDKNDKTKDDKTKDDKTKTNDEQKQDENQEQKNNNDSNKDIPKPNGNVKENDNDNDQEMSDKTKDDNNNNNNENNNTGNDGMDVE